MDQGQVEPVIAERVVVENGDGERPDRERQDLELPFPRHCTTPALDGSVVLDLLGLLCSIPQGERMGNRRIGRLAKLSELGEWSRSYASQPRNNEPGGKGLGSGTGLYLPLPG